MAFPLDFLGIGFSCLGDFEICLTVFQFQERCYGSSFRILDKEGHARGSFLLTYSATSVMIYVAYHTIPSREELVLVYDIMEFTGNR
jgi:hypothetical protein